MKMIGWSSKMWEFAEKAGTDSGLKTLPCLMAPRFLNLFPPNFLEKEYNSQKNA